MKKRILSYAVVISMIASLFVSVPVIAKEGTFGILTYTIENGEATITDCNENASGKIEIPATIGRYPVANIGNGAFADCSFLSTIIIPEGVRSIGANAFTDCKNLTGIGIPNSVTHIGDYSFSFCCSLASVTIPRFVEEIGNATFFHCDNLRSVTIPDEVISIGEDAFYNCWSMTNITIPDSVKNIETGAFSMCGSLSDVYYTGSEKEWNNIEIDSNNRELTNANVHYKEKDYLNYLTYIIENGEVIITGCDKVTSGEIEVPSTIEGYLVTNVGKYAFRECVNLISIILPESIKSIGYYAFSGCTKLISISIPESIEEIGAGAFFVCHNLVTGITIPEGSAGVGDYEFSGCYKLTEVKIPKSATFIGNKAFADCHSLTSINIQNVTSMDPEAFEKCLSLTSIETDENNEVYSSLNGNLFNKDKTKLLQYAIGKKNITYKIPEGVKSIGNYAFRDCSNLTSVTIPNSIENIGYEAFESCTNLTDVYFIGTEEEWNAIEIEKYGNEFLINATIHFEVEPGQNYTPGDLDGDGEISVKDVISIRRFIIGSFGTEIYNEVADVNQDGYVNVKDIILIRRYIAGGYGVEL